MSRFESGDSCSNLLGRRPNAPAVKKLAWPERKKAEHKNESALKSNGSSGDSGESCFKAVPDQKAKNGLVLSAGASHARVKSYPLRRKTSSFMARI